MIASQTNAFLLPFSFSLLTFLSFLFLLFPLLYSPSSWTTDTNVTVILSAANNPGLLLASEFPEVQRSRAREPRRNEESRMLAPELKAGGRS